MKPKHIKVRVAQCLAISEASNCPRRKFGALLFDPKRNIDLTSGYNGAPRGGGDLCGGDACDRDRLQIPSGERHEIGCHHAEQNAIANAAAHGIATLGAWMVCNGEPCLSCSRLIHHAGIEKVLVVSGGYVGANGVNYLREHGVEVELVEGPIDPRTFTVATVSVPFMPPLQVPMVVPVSMPEPPPVQVPESVPVRVPEPPPVQMPESVPIQRWAKVIEINGHVLTWSLAPNHFWKCACGLELQFPTLMDWATIEKTIRAVDPCSQPVSVDDSEPAPVPADDDEFETIEHAGHALKRKSMAGNVFRWQCTCDSSAWVQFPKGVDIVTVMRAIEQVPLLAARCPDAARPALALVSSDGAPVSVPEQVPVCGSEYPNKRLRSGLFCDKPPHDASVPHVGSYRNERIEWRVDPSVETIMAEAAEATREARAAEVAGEDRTDVLDMHLGTEGAKSVDGEGDEGGEIESEDDDETKEEAKEEKSSFFVKKAQPSSSPPVLDLSEGLYNQRDVLAMCRLYKPLADATIRTGSVNVYGVDLEMAHLALQMSRKGMPVDEVERERVLKHLDELFRAAVVALRPFTEGENYEAFIHWVATFQAATVRKKDPAAGMEVGGSVLSEELAFAQRVEIRTKEFLKKLGKEGVNFGAAIQQAAILRAAGVPLIKTTEKSKKPQVSAEVLEEFGYHDAARAMISFLKVGGVLRTLRGMSGSIVDGWLHPDWDIHKITGRWGSKPNVQNWSKRAGGGAENLRRIITAPAGYIFVGADQAQLEARLIAGCSQDPFLLDVFRTGQDIHGALAGVAFPTFPQHAEVFKKHKSKHADIKTKGIACGVSKEHPKCSDCEQRDKLRDLTKRLEYGAFYGGKDETLWQSIVKDYPDIKMELVRAFMANINKRMPGVISWRQRVLDEAIKNGEIRSPILGRRECFPLGRVDPTVAYNFLPQSGGADLWALGAIEFCKRWDQTKDDVRLIHNGHDSVLILCRENLVDKVEQDVRECWEREWNGVQFLMDCKSGDRWSDV